MKKKGKLLLHENQSVFLVLYISLHLGMSNQKKKKEKLLKFSLELQSMSFTAV